MPVRAATQVPLERQSLSDRDKVRVAQERASRLQREQATAANLADRHQKAVRRFLMAGINARAQQRAADISRQLGSTEVLTQPASGSGKLPIIAILLLVAGISFFRWRRSRGG